jgi:hypothetical protein
VHHNKFWLETESSVSFKLAVIISYCRMIHMKNLTDFQVTSQVVIIAKYLSIVLFEEDLIC